MKRKIKVFKLEGKQSSICNHMNEEKVKLLEVDERRLKVLKEREIRQKARIQGLKVWIRQNSADIQRIRSTKPLEHPEYIIHFSPTKNEPENKLRNTKIH
jgi:hypothetical protein